MSNIGLLAKHLASNVQRNTKRCSYYCCYIIKNESKWGTKKIWKYKSLGVVYWFALTSFLSGNQHFLSGHLIISLYFNANSSFPKNIPNLSHFTPLPQFNSILLRPHNTIVSKLRPKPPATKRGVQDWSGREWANNHNN